MGKGRPKGKKKDKKTLTSIDYTTPRRGTSQPAAPQPSSVTTSQADAVSRAQRAAAHAEGIRPSPRRADYTNDTHTDDDNVGSTLVSPTLETKVTPIVLAFGCSNTKLTKRKDPEHDPDNDTRISSWPTSIGRCSLRSRT